MGLSLLQRASSAAGGIEQLVNHVVAQESAARARRGLPELPEPELRALAERYLIQTWAYVGRDEQQFPGNPGAAVQRRDWRTWLIKPGRGWGKSRTASEAVRDLVKSGRYRSVAFGAPTYAKVRAQMLEHPETGLLTITPPEDRPEIIRNGKELSWPNGAHGYVISGEDEDSPRGFSGDLAWLDEFAAWKYPAGTWNNLQFGLRLRGPKGDPARAIVTTTPRPLQILREIMADPDTVVTDGSTFDNAGNLDPATLKSLRKAYEGTRLGEQELHGKVLTDTPGALWTDGLLEKLRMQHAPELRRVVIGVDPAVKDVSGLTENELEQLEETGTGETGIVAAGVGACSCKGEEELHGFVLTDASGFMMPDGWAEATATAFDESKADSVIAEINNGGALVESNLRTLGRANLPIQTVSAARGKLPRAEPISTLYERGMVHHVGHLPMLESQMTTWQPLISKKSPNRVDALVWALSFLMLGDQVPEFRRPRPVVRERLRRRI